MVDSTKGPQPKDYTDINSYINAYASWYYDNSEGYLLTNGQIDCLEVLWEIHLRELEEAKT